MANCKYNPTAPTTQLPLPGQWCNLIWGECQFVDSTLKDAPLWKTFSCELCPLRGQMQSWYEYWLKSQPDKSRKIRVRVGSAAPVEMSIQQAMVMISAGIAAIDV